MVNKKNIEAIINQLQGQTIVAATKYVEADDIKTLVDLGIRDIGENRVRTFLEKYDLLHDLDIVWHFIGQLQSKKVKKIIDKIDVLHSLDRLSLADEIEKRRKLPLKCFLEVNISEEASKSGLAPEEVLPFYEKMANYDKIQIVGLMGMAKLTDDEALIREEFLTLVRLRDQLQALDPNISWLSMGMSNDYQIAIDCGATHLRLGSILFQEDDHGTVFQA